MSRVSQEAEVKLKELLGEVPAVPPVQELLDARLETVGEGHATFSMKADKQHHNVINVVHGGLLTSLAELAASVAILTQLEDKEAFTFIDQTTNYERPVVSGRLKATAEVIRRGSRISLIEVILENEAGKEVSRARFTAFIQSIER